MFLRNNTVDKAIAPLLKAQADLSAVSDERSKTIGSNLAEIDRLQADNVLADVERTRANRIHNALADITDPKSEG